MDGQSELLHVAHHEKNLSAAASTPARLLTVPNDGHQRHQSPVQIKINWEGHVLASLPHPGFHILQVPSKFPGTKLWTNV